MYSFFNNLKKNPILILGILIVSTVLLLSVSSGVTSLGTMLGFETKENVSIQLAKTTNELEKVVEVLENNALEVKVEKAIDVITEAKTINDAVIVDGIKAEEVKVLDQIKNTIVVDDNTDVKPDVIRSNVKVKPTIVYTVKKVNNKQKLALSILRDRANLLKGSRT